MEQQRVNHLTVDVVIIGAGHAGLSASYCLKQQGINHVVFERGQIGESWCSQRWNSFSMNTSIKTNLLPGQTYTGNTPENFCSGKEFASSLGAYAVLHELPVKTHTKVISVEKPDNSNNFIVTVSASDELKSYECKQVVVASGNQNEKKIPSFAKNIGSHIFQLHTNEYRSADQLPTGAVLVVGSGQSGSQIAEDLALAGREVYLSTSRVARVPRRYRGKDIVDWLIMLGFYDLKADDVTEPKIFAAKVPLVSGVGEFGHTMSLQSLAKMGVTILGKAENADAANLFFAANAHEHVKFGDASSQKVKVMVDEFIEKTSTPAPPSEEDEADMPDNSASCASSITSLNLKEHNVTSIIWTTGFNGDFSFIKLPVLDNDGNPKHKNGTTDIKGLYFLGLSWLRKRGSGMVLGINDDAPFIVDRVKNYGN